MRCCYFAIGDQASRPAFSLHGGNVYFPGILARLPEIGAYVIVPFALVLLFRREQGPRVETVTSLYFVTLAMIFIYAIQNNYFFL